MYNFKKGYYTDVRIERRYQTRIQYKDGKLENFLVRQTKGAFIRVFDGKLWYYASTAILSDIEQEIAKLYELATENNDIDNHPIVKKFQNNQATKKIFVDNNVANVSKDEKMKVLQDCFQTLAAKEEIKMWLALYIDRHSDYEFYSSKGSNISYDYQTAGIVIPFAMSDGRSLFQSQYQKATTDFSNIHVDQKELGEFLDLAADYLYNAQDVVPGDYPVVLSPLAAGVFAHESFGHKSEADFMIGDETMKEEWKIGKQVASSKLSIVDTGLEQGSGYVPFDDEGTMATKTYLIKNGILRGRLHSGVTSAMLEEEVTGNARAINTKFEPIVRMTSTYIEGGDLTLDELLGKVKHGYYIKTINHGSGMSTFTIAPNLAYEIKDGKIANPVKISVITGSVFETLGLITDLTTDIEKTSFVGAGCGKMEQYPLPVGFGAPYVLVSKMRVQ